MIAFIPRIAFTCVHFRYLCTMAAYFLGIFVFATVVGKLDTSSNAAFVIIIIGKKNTITYNKQQ